MASKKFNYGHDRTIHRTGHLNVETRNGKVVAVWYRCQMLPFEQREVDEYRAKSMQAGDWQLPFIHGIDLESE